MNKPGYLVDSCVILDAVLPFRAGHKAAQAFFEEAANSDQVCFISSHAYFEFVTATVIHFKRKTEVDQLLRDGAIGGHFSRCRIEVIALDKDYVETLFSQLLERPVPDLKSPDLILFCLAKNRGLTLITADRKLRNAARKGQIEAFEPEEVSGTTSETAT